MFQHNIEAQNWISGFRKSKLAYLAYFSSSLGPEDHYKSHNMSKPLPT